MPPTARQRPAQQPPLHPALSVPAVSSRACHALLVHASRSPPNWTFAYLRNLILARRAGGRRPSMLASGRVVMAVRSAASALGCGACRRMASATPSPERSTHPARPAGLMIADAVRYVRAPSARSRVARAATALGRSRRSARRTRLSAVPIHLVGLPPAHSAAPPPYGFAPFGAVSHLLAGAAWAGQTVGNREEGDVGAQAASPLVGVPAAAAPGADPAQPHRATARPGAHDPRPADDRRPPGAAGRVRLP